MLMLLHRLRRSIPPSERMEKTRSGYVIPHQQQGDAHRRERNSGEGGVSPRSLRLFSHFSGDTMRGMWSGFFGGCADRRAQKAMSLMWTVKVVGLGAVALSLSLEALAWLHRRLRPGKILNEVLFFPSETACVQHIFTPPSPYSCFCSLPHGVETSFSRLLSYLMSASSSLDLCVFAFSNMDLCRAVVALHHRGVNVRVLTDKDYSAITGSQIGVLRKAGICVRSDINSVYMHHKFAVVDGRLLITGSLNWTLTAVQSNMENVIITEEPDLVRPFIQEFRSYGHMRRVGTRER